MVKEHFRLHDLDVRGKRVLVRVDFNVPIEDGRITDDTRIRSALPTIVKLMRSSAKLILVTHLGRPKGFDPTLSTQPLALKLSRLMDQPVRHVGACIGTAVEQVIAELRNGDIVLLENVRYYNEEIENDADFSRKLANLADIYVNDAFGTAHRAHASTEGVTRHFKHRAAGLLMEKEMTYLQKAIQDADHPFVAILGGAKISDKIGVIETLIHKIDGLLIGGGMAYTFLKAMGLEIGNSVVEPDKLGVASEILRKARHGNLKVYLPKDHVIGRKVCHDTQSRLVDHGIPAGWRGLDIGPKTIESFGNVIDTAKIILWNGPLGVYEFENFAHGTIEIATRVAQSTAVSIVGGGDCVAAVRKAGVTEGITHISTGGGASLEFLEGKELPGIASLTDRNS